MEHAIDKGRDLPQWSAPSGVTRAALGETVLSFLDTTATSFGRATHYNSRDAQQRAEVASHRSMLGLDRDLYALLLMLPGTTDRSSQLGIKNLLGEQRNGSPATLIGPVGEREVLYRLIGELPPQRIFKLFEALRYGSEADGIPRANNARTRKLVLRTILGAKKLELWSVKYRLKMRTALTHVWGQKTAGAIKAILTRGSNDWTDKEKSIVRRNIAVPARHHNALKSEFSQYLHDLSGVFECVSFVLGNTQGPGYQGAWISPLLKARLEARTDLKAGSRLPPEVLEGLRSTFHKDVAKEEILKTAAREGTMTKGQRMESQKRAKSAGVKVEMDPTDYDVVRLYLYAFEVGMDDKVRAALNAKAAKAAAAFPSKYDSLGIVVDCSKSMSGDKTQPLRPMAATLAMRDMLSATAQRSRIIYCGGKPVDGPGDVSGWSPVFALMQPEGGTNLADAMLELFGENVDTVFVLSDGYENMPAGRFAETLGHAREIGIQTPVYHINPVFAAEAGGVRELAPDHAPTVPVQTPEAMGVGFVRGLIENDPERGVNALVGMTLPVLTGGA